MKSLLVLSILLLSTTIANAHSHFPSLEGKLLSKKEITLPVDIGSTKVKFTNLGYEHTFFVKVIVPELAAHTVLNHRNIGEDGPCLVSYDTVNVDDVIQGDPQVIPTKFKIKLRKVSHVNRNGICKSRLIESIEAKIRGFSFVHRLEHELPDRVEEDCI